MGNFQDAQDIAQEAFLKAYGKLADLEKPDRFAGWLHTIVCNLCHDHLRTRRPSVSLEEGISFTPIDP
ncbi:MAG: sigma factor, partial [bacterium]|nr:sigma factor [bacterium]